MESHIVLGLKTWAVTPSRSEGLEITTPRLVAWLVAVAALTAPACAFLDKVDKVSKIPGLEEAQLKEALKKPPGRMGQDEPSSPLQTTPSILDFGRAFVGSESQKTVVIFNPLDFPVTVIHVIVQGCGFALSGPPSNRPIIPPHGQLVLTVGFQPVARRACSGFLLLEIDSAGGRFTRVALTGRGI
jgi:hypothetical protein